MRSSHRFATLRCAALSAFFWFSTFLSAQPVVTLSPTSLSFGSQTVGVSSSVQVVTLTNTGTSSLTLTGIRITGGNSKDFSQTNTCGSSLGVNASCTISVKFTPTQTGSRTSSLSFTDNAAGSPQTVALSGTGVAPTATLTPASLSFTGVLVGKSSATQSVTLSNTGTASLTVSAVTASGDFSQTNNCTSGVAAGSSCMITITFSPTAAWSRSGSIVVTDNSYNNPQQVVLLVGMGNSGATASLSPTSLSFGNQTLGTGSAVKTVTLSNTGTAALYVTSVLASGDYSQTNNCPASLNAGANCAISVAFTPSSTGPRTGYVTVNDTDPSFLQKVTLSGTGKVASAVVDVSPGQASITPTQTQQFSATISGVTSTNVNWSVDSVPGGNSTVGTISTSGLYTPPTTSATHVIEAANKSNLSQTAVAFLAVTNYSGTFTSKNDTLRSGQNLNEIALTTANVNKNQFGKLFSRPVDGYVYAQPLYVPDVTTSAGTYNVVYVATENDSVYAFDADGTETSPLWQTSFLTGGAQVLTTTDINCSNITPVIGITSTPVIDPLTNTMFVLGRTKTGTSGNYTYYQTLYALDITTGAILQSVQVQASASSKSGTVTFNPLTENQRAALLLESGVVYIAWASHCDQEPYRGWLMGYNETTLQQSGVFLTTPNGEEGGIWQGGGGVTADGNGNLFLTTANGTFDASTGGVDYGDSVLKVTTTSGTLAVGDFFTPYNQQTLTNVDWDVGAGGTILLPDQAGSYPHVMLAGGKGSTVYELNRDSLGGFNTTANQNLLTVPSVLGVDKIGAGNRAAGPAYWQEQVY